MKKMIVAGAVALAAASASGVPALGHDHRHREPYSAGEPLDPAKPPRTVAPKKTAEIVWKFTKPGTFEYPPDPRSIGFTA